MPATTTNPPREPKTPIYEVLATLNQHFDQVLTDLGRIEALGVLRDRFHREFLRASLASIQEPRAWICDEVLQVLQREEERNRGRFGRIRDEWERKFKDPQDVLIQAERIRSGKKRSRR